MGWNDNEYVYLLHSVYGVKIGRTIAPYSRIPTIRTQMPFKLTKEEIFKVPNCKIMELQLHRYFDAKRINGEWFDLDDSDIELARRLINCTKDKGYLGGIGVFREADYVKKIISFVLDPVLNDFHKDIMKHKRRFRYSESWDAYILKLIKKDMEKNKD